MVTPLRLISLIAVVAAAPVAAQMAAPYGPSGAGFAGIEPKIWIDGEPRLGALSFSVTLDEAVGGGNGALLIGSVAGSLDVLGVEILVDPLGSVFVATPGQLLGGAAGVAGAGSAVWPLRLPSSPSFFGASFFAQALIADAGAPFGLAASDGLRFTLRDNPPATILLLENALRVVPAIGPGVTVNAPASASGSLSPLPANGRLLVTNASGFGSGTIIDTATNTVVGTITPPGSELVGSFVPHPVAPRAYAVLTSFSSGRPLSSLWSVDFDPGSPTFGNTLSLLRQFSHIAGEPVLSADGRRLAVSVGDLGVIFASFDVFDVDPSSPNRDTLVTSIRHGLGSIVRPIALDPKGEILFAGDPIQPSLLRFDVATGQLTTTTSLSSAALEVLCDPRGRYLAARSGGLFGAGVGFDLVDLGPGSSVTGTRQIVFGGVTQALALSGDGDTIAYASGTSSRLVDPHTGLVFGIPIVTLGSIEDLALR